MDRRDLTPDAMASHAVAGRPGRRRPVAGRRRPGRRRPTPWAAACATRAASAARAGCATSASGTPASSTSTTRAPAAPRPCTSASWPPWPGSHRCSSSGSRRCGPGTGRETIAGIEDGLPSDERAELRVHLDNDAGSVLMALNATWVRHQIEVRGTTPQQIAAAAAKARRCGARNPLAQFRTPVTVEEVLASPVVVAAAHPAHVLVVHRRRRRRRAVGRNRARRTPGAGQHPAVGQRRPRLPRPPRETGGRSLEGGRASGPRTSTSSSCTTPPAPRSSTPSSRWGSSPPATPARPPWPATPTSAAGPSASTRAAASWPAATPSAPPGICQIAELVAPAARHGHGPPGPRARLGRGRQHRRDHGGQGRRPRRHPRPRASLTRCPEQSSPVGASPYPTRSSPTRTSRPASTRATQWITERTGIRERRIGGTTSELAIAAGAQALARAGRTGDDVDVLVLATSTPDALVPGTSATVQDAPRASRGGAFDVNAACSGFVYALVAAHGLVAGGRPAGPRHRQRDAVAHHRLGRPQPGRPRRRRGRRRGARGHRRSRPAARLGPRRRRVACATCSSATTAGTST